MTDEPSTTVACTMTGTSKLPKREVVLVNHPTSELYPIMEYFEVVLCIHPLVG